MITEKERIRRIEGVVELYHLWESGKLTRQGYVEELIKFFHLEEKFEIK